MSRNSLTPALSQRCYAGRDDTPGEGDASALVIVPDCCARRYSRTINGIDANQDSEPSENADRDSLSRAVIACRFAARERAGVRALNCAK